MANALTCCVTNLRLILRALGASLFLTGCAAQMDMPIDPLATIDYDAALASCCQDNEALPPQVTALFEGSAPTIIPVTRVLRVRSGYLHNNIAAQDRIYSALEPLDLINTSIKNQLSGQMLAGYFNHTAIYLGTEDQLRARGLWDDPRIRPFHDQINAGFNVIEANGHDVRLADRAILFNIDGIAIFRPPPMTRSRQRAVYATLLGHVGAPFDFHFDLDTKDCLFCVELANLAMPELQLPVREIYGRPTILPDEIAADALRGRNGLQFVGFIYGKRGEWGVGSKAMLGQAIARQWPTQSGL